MLDCNKDFDECDCSCHKTGAVHCIACCNFCLRCKRNIKLQLYEDHQKSCEKELLKTEDELIIKHLNGLWKTLGLK